MQYVEKPSDDQVFYLTTKGMGEKLVEPNIRRPVKSEASFNELVKNPFLKGHFVSMIGRGELAIMQEEYPGVTGKDIRALVKEMEESVLVAKSKGRVAKNSVLEDNINMKTIGELYKSQKVSTKKNPLRYADGRGAIIPPGKTDTCTPYSGKKKKGKNSAYKDCKSKVKKKLKKSMSDSECNVNVALLEKSLGKSLNKKIGKTKTGKVVRHEGNYYKEDMFKDWNARDHHEAMKLHGRKRDQYRVDADQARIDGDEYEADRSRMLASKHSDANWRHENKRNDLWKMEKSLVDIEKSLNKGPKLYLSKSCKIPHQYKSKKKKKGLVGAKLQPNSDRSRSR